jgi:hypothetical protein
MAAQRSAVFCAVVFLALSLGAGTSPAVAQSLDCSGAYASPGSTWPPNHKFVDISI